MLNVSRAAWNFLLDVEAELVYWQENERIPYNKVLGEPYPQLVVVETLGMWGATKRVEPTLDGGDAGVWECQLSTAGRAALHG
jgi:hypothetical protein